MQHPHPESLNPDVDYERTTISFPLIVGLTIGFIVFGILTAIAMRITWKQMSKHETEKSIVTSTVMTNTVITPMPRLQPSPGNDSMPWEDLRKMRDAEYTSFQQRGWVDEKSHQIVIPDAIIHQVTQLSTPVAATPASRSSHPPPPSSVGATLVSPSSPLSSPATPATGGAQ